MRRLSDESVRLLRLARAQQETIRDIQVHSCWYIIAEAIANQWLGATGWLSVDSLVQEIDLDGGFTVEEYSVEVDNDRGGDTNQVVVQLVNERHVCPRAELVSELRRLAASYRNESR